MASNNTAVSELTVRLAVEADTPKLLGKVSDGVYEGLDYFAPDLYTYWTEPHRVTFLCETPEGEVVGIESLKVVDNGTTGITQSLRVLPSWQGKGVGSLLSARMQEHIKSQRNILYLRTTMRQTAAASMRIHEKAGFRVVHKQGTYIIHPNLTRGKVSGYEGVLASLQRLTDPAEIREAVLPFLTHPSNDYQSYLNAEWVLYDMKDPEVAAKNIRHMTETYGVSFFVDREKDIFLLSQERVGARRLPRGNTLIFTLLTKGREEHIHDLAVAQYNRAVELECHSCEGFFDGSLFQAGEVSPLVARIAEVTSGTLDVDAFDLTRAGMAAMEKEVVHEPLGAES